MREQVGGFTLIQGSKISCHTVFPSPSYTENFSCGKKAGRTRIPLSERLANYGFGPKLVDLLFLYNLKAKHSFKFLNS